MMQQKGLSILVYKPDPSGYTPDDIFLMNLEKEIDSYTQTIQAIGGYWQATFTVRDRLDKAEDWIDDGLGWHVETYNPGLARIWEGFVNKVTLNVGGFQIVRGPLVDIANRVSLIYSTVDTSILPPAIGMRVREGPQNDTDSQALYGIIEKVLSAGGIPAGNADDILTTYITEYALPETSKSLSTDRQSEPVVTVECLGYVHWLRLYTYAQTANTGTQNLSAKIEDILDADPNSLFASTNADITANTLAVKQFENNDRTAWALIKSLTAKGDAAGDRYLFGVYNNRRVEYDVIPTDIEYQQHLTSQAQKITTLAGAEVKPWNIRAGRWLFLPDFLIGRTQPANLREDPRMLFIESATYVAPWSLNLNGGKVDTLSQKLARLGLSGIGAG